MSKLETEKHIMITFERLVALNPEMKDKSPLIVIPTPILKEMKNELLRQLGEIEVELADREAFMRELRRMQLEVNAPLN